jgi:hypothetical protein
MLPKATHYSNFRNVNKNKLFFNGTISPHHSGPRPHCFAIILRHTTSFGRDPLDERSARRTHLYLYNTHNIHNRYPCPLRQDSNRNPSKRTTADPRLRERGYWDRLFIRLDFINHVKRFTKLSKSNEHLLKFENIL